MAGQRELCRLIKAKTNNNFMLILEEVASTEGGQNTELEIWWSQVQVVYSEHWYCFNNQLIRHAKE